jgi:hypothetical protein
VWPAEVPLASQRVIEEPLFALDLVSPDDRNTGIDGRRRTLSEGADIIQVHPLHHADRHIGPHFSDVGPPRRCHPRICHRVR